MGQNIDVKEFTEYEPDKYAKYLDSNRCPLVEHRMVKPSTCKRCSFSGGYLYTSPLKREAVVEKLGACIFPQMISDKVDMKTVVYYRFVKIKCCFELE